MDKDIKATSVCDINTIDPYLEWALEKCEETAQSASDEIPEVCEEAVRRMLVDKFDCRDAAMINGIAGRTASDAVHAALVKYFKFRAIRNIKNQSVESIQEFLDLSNRRRCDISGATGEYDSCDHEMGFLRALVGEEVEEMYWEGRDDYTFVLDGAQEGEEVRVVMDQAFFIKLAMRELKNTVGVLNSIER